MKAKNSIDLLDFKVSVVGDSPDDWDEIKSMRQQVTEQTARLNKYERSETKLIEEVKLLRNQLQDALSKNSDNEHKV